MNVSVIIPALNEEEALGQVLAALPRPPVTQVIVADNGSTDATATVAAQAGAEVVQEDRRGYGWACLAGMAQLTDPDVVVFLDGDNSDYPEELPLLLAPILEGRADVVIGSRMLGQREPGALPPHSRFGNWLAGAMIRVLFGVRTTDLGPFRALRWETLQALQMEDKTYGWTAEMQAKAARDGWRMVEVPVRYRKRIGRSKITGSLVASVKAGAKIITTILKYGLSRRRRRADARP